MNTQVAITEVHSLVHCFLTNLMNLSQFHTSQISVPFVYALKVNNYKDIYSRGEMGIEKTHNLKNEIFIILLILQTSNTQNFSYCNKKSLTRFKILPSLLLGNLNKNPKYISFLL